jgi:hypothetical protein
MIKQIEVGDDPLPGGKDIRDTGDGNNNTALDVYRMLVWLGPGASPFGIIGIAGLISCGKSMGLFVDA